MTNEKMTVKQVAKLMNEDNSLFIDHNDVISPQTAAALLKDRDATEQKIVDENEYSLWESSKHHIDHYADRYADFVGIPAKKLAKKLNKRWEGFNYKWVGDMQHNTTLNFTINLELEHEHAGYQIGADFEDGLLASDDNALDFFGINPLLVSQYYGLERPFDDYFYRKTPLVDPSKLFESWNNCPYGGQYVILWEASLYDALELNDHIRRGGSIKLGKGSLIMPHDYANGSSGLEMTTLHDVIIPASLVAGVYCDEANKYGVDAVNVLTQQAWQQSEVEKHFAHEDEQDKLVLTASKYDRNIDAHINLLIHPSGSARVEMWRKPPDYERGVAEYLPNQYKIVDGLLLFAIHDYPTTEAAQSLFNSMGSK